MKNSIGKVLDKSSIKELSFVATEQFQGEFVEIPINYSNGEKATIVGEIVYKEAINPHFEKPSSINYLSEKDESITSWNLYIIKVKPIALIENDEIKKIDFPPPPGTNVYVAERNLVNRALGLETEGIQIGYLKQLKSLKIHISEAKLCRTHFSILGRTGSGKSYFAKGIFKLIKDRKLIIFSPTDEYNEIAENIGAQILSKDDFVLPFNIDYMASIYGFTLQEQIIFEEFMKKEKSFTEGANLSNKEIAQKFRSKIQYKPKQATLSNIEIESSQNEIFTEEKISKSADTILSKLRSKTLLFSKQPTRVPFSKSTIINMSEIEQESQEVIIKYVLSNLLEYYKDEQFRKNKPKLIVAIEESHNFAPSVQTTFCKNKIIQTAREGRKLGITLSLISQRPRHIDQTVLSQCGTLFLFHIPHPDDIEHIFGISPIYRGDLIDMVRELAVGECLILGDATKYPLLCSINFEGFNLEPIRKVLPP